MTEHFEVLERDGSARLGQLRLSSPITTPALADGCFTDAGSAWVEEPTSPEGGDDTVTILPHRAFPAGTPEEVVEAFGRDTADRPDPTAVVIHQSEASDRGADAYVLSGANGVIGRARDLVETIIEIREAVPADTALYLPGVATPANTPLLAYLGVDVVDTDYARVAGSRGEYLTAHGRYELDRLEDLPCACAACERGRSGFGERDCIDHNVTVLRGTLETVRERIRQGRLRDFVSARVRHVPWLTAGLRRADEQYAYLERHTPLFRQSTLFATTEDDLHRPAVRRFRERVEERYRSRFRTPLVLLPCSAAKPYSQSQSHRQFRDAISHRAHRVALSSPIGVVPQELECTYPAQHYDVPVTGRWSAGEIDIVASSLERYLSRHAYPRVIAHVAPGPYRDLVERAAAGSDVDVTYTVTDHPTTPTSLGALEEALDRELKYTRRDRRSNTVRAIADYQFGEGAGDALFDDVTIEAPYPKHRVLNQDGALLCTMVPEYGLLALTVEGARRWEECDVPTRHVEIDDFVPHGDVLAPGIRDADPQIRIGDEVIVSGPSAYAIGRARMTGHEMRASTRGVAVDVRHTEER